MVHSIDVLFSTAKGYSWGVNSSMYTLEVYRTSPGSSLNFIQVVWVYLSVFVSLFFFLFVLFSFLTKIAFSFLQPSHGQVLSLPSSLILCALQINFFRLMFLAYFTSENGSLVCFKGPSHKIFITFPIAESNLYYQPIFLEVIFRNDCSDKQVTFKLIPLVNQKINK